MPGNDAGPGSGGYHWLRIPNFMPRSRVAVEPSQRYRHVSDVRVRFRTRSPPGGFLREFGAVSKMVAPGADVHASR